MSNKDTCEGCFLFTSQSKRCALRGDALCEYTDPCDDILHTIAYRHMHAMERIAEKLNPMATLDAKDAAVRAVEAWRDYSGGRADSNTFQLALGKYEQAKRGDGNV